MLTIRSGDEDSDATAGWFQDRRNRPVDTERNSSRAIGAIDSFEDDHRFLSLAALAHDLRAPLTVIKASAQLLDRQIKAMDGVPPIMTASTAMIARASDRVARMMGSLDELAQANAGMSPGLKRHPTDLVTIARRIAEEHQVLWSERAITVTSDTVELVGNWDADHLARVVANLLTNALTYSPAAAPVTVHTGCDGDGWARLQVSDEGIGIPAADLPHVFTPYFRGTNAIRHGSGTGIGLSSVRAVVEQHGGAVDLVSAQGQGTTVSIRLPLGDPTTT